MKDRVDIWTELYEKQIKIINEFPQDKIIVTMPDGNKHEGIAFKTTPFDIASKISKGLAKATILAKVKYTKRVATLDDGLFNPEAGEDGKDEEE